MNWGSACRAYDDDTLVALANPGLLRRAANDVEAGKVQWASEDTSDKQAGRLVADGQTVTLDAKGPQFARCNCPAPGLCKHILAAVLWLRDAPTPPLDPLADILALDSGALCKAAGVAAVRRAAQAATTGYPALEWRVQGATVVMDLAELGVTCRWVAGAGFAGMVSDVPAKEQKLVHLLALAALRSAVGQPLQWPATGPGNSTAPDTAGATLQVTQGLSASEHQFVGQVRASLHELLTSGLSHVSSLASARLLALNMSARGEGLARLAALLRNIGGMVDLLVRHDHQAQEADALALLSRAHALCDALTDAQLHTSPAACLAELKGNTRREYVASAQLELLPLGAHWWQTLGGARGLSLALWDVASQRLLQATLARPDASDPAFTRHSAWAAQSLWAGGGSAQTVCESPLCLFAPRLADDDRLAVGGTSRAQPLPAWAAHDPRVAALGIGDWADLHHQLAQSVGLGAPAGDLLLLRPSATRAPVLHEAEQQLHWPVQDAAGRWLALVMPLGPATEQRAQNLDRLTARGAPVHAVLVRLERSHAATQLVPVAVLSTQAKGQLHAISLDFAQEQSKPTPLGQRILRMLQARLQAATSNLTGTTPTAPRAPHARMAERLLSPVLQVLEAQASTGRMVLSASQKDTLSRAEAALESVGLHSLGTALRAHLAAPGPATLLRLHRVSQWALELDGLPAL